MQPARARRPLCILLALLALASGPVVADTVTLPDLYVATVPVAGTGEGAQQAAFRAALEDVLVRVTGRRDAPQLEALAPLVADAARYVTSFRRATGSQVAVRFNAQAIENAIDAAGLPFWGAERPVVLVWLMVDRGGGQWSLVLATTAGEERQRVAQAAARRGLPLVWPGAGEDTAAALHWIAAGEQPPLVAAAQRYGADGVLIGRVAPGGSAARPVEWSFSGAGTFAESTGVLETGPELAADRYAGLMASRTAGQRSEELVTITGIDSLEAFAGAERALGRVPVVRSITLFEVAPDAVTFLLTIRGAAPALVAALQRDAGLRLVDGPRMIFALGP